MSPSGQRVAVTGACGNLGRKLVAHLIAADWCDEILALDLIAFEGGGPKVTAVVADLTDRMDRRWLDAIEGADAIVHFAARRPTVDATWDDAAVSIDMTLNLTGAAIAAGIGRFVFATSNHVMGGYKEESDRMAPGSLTVDLSPRPGTQVREPDGSLSLPYPYAVTKLTGERICHERARGSLGRLTAVSVRIGWCQPGVNRPETLNASGQPGVEDAGPQDAEAKRDLAWFRNMWLSNRDFAEIFERAILADAAGWPAPAIIVNGMSDNSGMPWDIATTARLIGYEAADDVAKG